MNTIYLQTISSIRLWLNRVQLKGNNYLMTMSIHRSIIDLQMKKSQSFAGLTRSELMSRIHARGNKNTEMKMVNILKKNKISGWRRHLPLPGTPDFTFSRQKVILFVDGCFWHGCPKHLNRIATNRKYWTAKIGSNKVRDKTLTRVLKSRGWKVLRIWEHDLSKKNEIMLIARLRCILN